MDDPGKLRVSIPALPDKARPRQYLLGGGEAAGCRGNEG